MNAYLVLIRPAMLVNMDFQPNLAPYEGSGGNLDNTVACTNAVQTAGYTPSLQPIGGATSDMSPIVDQNTNDPTSFFGGGIESNPLSSQGSPAAEYITSPTLYTGALLQPE